MRNEETSQRLEELRKAADAAARNARNSFVTFILVGVYIAVIIGSTTDEQLLRGSGIILPLVQVVMPIVGVYMFVPPLFVLLHFGLLLQLTFLSRSLFRLNREIGLLRISADRDRERDLIFPFPFSHLIVGCHHSKTFRLVIRLISWVTVMILPVFLLLWAQVAFLPYHSEPVTWGAHRLWVFADLTFLWFFWPRLFDPDGKCRPWIRRRPGFWRSGAWRFGAGCLCTIVTVWLSGFVLVIPGEWIELPKMRLVIAHLFGDNGYGRASDTREWYEAWFNRNLVLSDETLVDELPAPEIVAAYLRQGKTAEDAFLDFGTGLDLQNRDLRLAYFFRTNLAKANLISAKLQGAVLVAAGLQNAQLNYANLQNADLFGAKLHGADLNDAALEGASLQLAKLPGAKLGGAKQPGAKLSDAKRPVEIFKDVHLQGGSVARTGLHDVTLVGAELSGVDLSHADLLGRNLTRTKLLGADLSGAKLQGALLISADLQGADLSGAKLQGAILTNAKLQGADLSGTFLRGADFTGANFRLADLRNAEFEDLTVAGSAPPTIKIARQAQNKQFDREDSPRSTTRRDLPLAVSQSDTTLPDYEPKWYAIYDKLLETHLDRRGSPLQRWPQPPVEDEQYLDRLAPFLTGLACNDKYVAQGIAKQIIGSKFGARTGARMLAQALVKRAGDKESCPGVAALSAGDLARLKESAAKSAD